MNGIHDMGGMHGFGKVEPEQNEPVFHADWEGRALAMNRLMSFAKIWETGETRAAIENLPPEVYLSSTYYRKWTLMLEQLVLKYGLVDPDEFAARRALRPGKRLPRKLAAADIAKALTRGSYARPVSAPARFAAGDRVCTRNMNPATHTRLPRYARGKLGVIEAVRGCHVFADTVAIGQGENPQWLYTVVFESRELWGEDADPTLTVSIEAWEPYLEPA